MQLHDELCLMPGGHALDPLQLWGSRSPRPGSFGYLCLVWKITTPAGVPKTAQALNPADPKPGPKHATPEHLQTLFARIGVV